MLQQNHAQTLRQTHRTMTTIMPLVTAALTVTGVLLSAAESKAQKVEKETRQDQTSDQANVAAQAPSTQYAYDALTVRAYLFTLVSKALLVVVGIALVLGLVALALRSGPTGVAIELTVLILLALYLTEKVARKQARQQRRTRHA